MQRQISQTTTCPACATMFRVGDDQLMVAQGWVRCGQCAKVFDASDRLLPDSAVEADARASCAPQEHHADDQPEAAADLDVAKIASQPALNSALSPKIHDAPEPPDSEGRQEPAFAADIFNVEPASMAQTQAPGVSDLPGMAQPDQDALPAQEPDAFPDVDFIKKAQRQDAWKSPLVRTLLGMACLALALALALQWAVRQKDVLAAQDPRLVLWLQAMCRPLGCELRPLRRIESLVIENSSFSRTGPDAYRLRFTLKNTGNAALEIPAMEVTLTDSQEQALVRRVTLPAEFGATAATLAAQSELAGDLVLKVSVPAGAPANLALEPAVFLPVTGYRILAFYP